MVNQNSTEKENNTNNNDAINCMLYATIMHCYADAIPQSELIDESIHNQMNVSMCLHSDAFVTMLDHPSATKVTCVATTDNENNNTSTTNANAILGPSYNEQQ